ncbi:glutathione S-transferase family protein [Pseudomonas chlororaphis]|uniref:glutathione S-transferase family protein n=1 Tax=Pseudomonas chlororaphis TaxID=587753 RepID=UPI000F570B07|nr:glutathione S-transferase [Pseudomonas chlororaphis]AZC49926.1 putative GST-like protein yncG [Pseudomonas chlororaphis subsp. piscium]AZC56505.1 putative GST-like protein yncG [Pseudomonas chlororaphis subsp. piscium]AZC68959.1 putative GST-like protein yncG [Pseudomonas chlororaphis subsp. piscium]AZC75143.1 putative GST-like protein yncG [Pseudomonas chlororaphis subsp. piscium]AZC81410.1 putative GST-like protein yncG [Pseudomonas chlororaphis subsp. piscium]
MYQLYGTQGSGSAIVEIALECCQVPYRILEAAPWEDSPGLAALARINPLKQIPTLQLPDGSILTESAAILIELGLRYPRSALLPADEGARAQAIRGLVFIAANCYSAIGVIDYPERWLQGADDALKERVRDAARERLHHNWEVFADQFATQLYASGSPLAALDFQAAVVSRWSGTREHLQRERPEFCALLERIDRHPQVAQVLARHWPG